MRFLNLCSAKSEYIQQTARADLGISDYRIIYYVSTHEMERLATSLDITVSIVCVYI